MEKLEVIGISYMYMGTLKTIIDYGNTGLDLLKNFRLYIDKFLASGKATANIDILMDETVTNFQNLMAWVDTTNSSHLADVIADKAWEINYNNPAACVSTVVNGTTTIAGCPFVTAFINNLGVVDDASTFASLYPNTTDTTLTLDSFNWGENSTYGDSFTELNQLKDIE